MKLFIKHPNQIRLPARRSRGFTLVETLLSSFLFSIIILGGFIAVNLVGLKENQLLQCKAGVSDSTRRQINQFRNGSSFTAITNGAYMQGNALMIYPLIMISNEVVNVTNYILYYFDSSAVANLNGRLCYTNSSGVGLTVVSNLYNPLFFTCEDYTGATQRNSAYNSVIHTTFNFSQFQYPTALIGSNGLFNSYHLDVRATPHLPDGP
jgi:Tfp pilus assembly protein PilV